MAVNASMKDYMIGFIGVMLFFILIMQFAVNIGNEYGLDANEMGAEYLDYEDINDSLSSIEAQSQTWRAGFEQEDPAEPDLTSGVNIQYIWGVLKLMFSFMTVPFTLLSSVVVNVTKVPAIVANIGVAVLIIGVLLSIWRALRIGE